MGLRGGVGYGWMGYGLAVVLMLGTALGADNPLAAFPESTDVVVCLKNPNATKAKIVALAEAVKEGAGDQAELVGNFLGPMINNLNMDGVDQDDDWWVGVFFDAEDDPQIVFAIPASDIDAMQEALGEETPFLKHEKWGVYSENEDAIAAIKAHLEAKTKSKSILESVSKKAVSVLAQGDLAVYVNIANLTETFGTQIEAAEEQIQQQIEAGDDANAAMAGKMIETAFAVLGDGEGLSLALSLDKTGVTFEDLVEFDPESETGKYLATTKGNGGLPSFAGLPSDAVIYLALDGQVTKALMLWTNSFVVQMLEDQEAEADQIKAVKGVEADLKKVQIGSVLSAISLTPGETGVLRTVSLYNTTAGAALSQTIQKVLKAQDGLVTSGLKMTVEVQPAAEKYGSVMADLFKLTQEPAEDGNPFVGDFLKKFYGILYGEEGLVTRNAVLKDKIVQTMGGGKAAMTDALKLAGAATPAKPTGPRANALQAVKTKLGDKGVGVVYFDLAGLATRILQTAMLQEDVPELPIDKEELAGLEQKPSYLGVLLQIEGSSAGTKTFVPVEQMQTIGDLSGLIIPAVMQMQGGPGF